MVFSGGHLIRLDVQLRDGVGSAGYLHYHADYNTGRNTIYAAGEHEVVSAAADHTDETVIGSLGMPA